MQTHPATYALSLAVDVVTQNFNNSTQWANNRDLLLSWYVLQAGEEFLENSKDDGSMDITIKDVEYTSNRLLNALA
jgi:hypothetical protein